MEHHSEIEARQKLSELVRDFDTAMLVTLHVDGSAHARPMAVAEVRGDAELWFATSTASPKVDEVLSDERVLVVMQKSQRYLSLNGTAELHRDPERVQQLWSDAWRVWFKGPHDPDLVLMRVRPNAAEYWDNTGMAGVRFLFHAAKAIVSGEEVHSSDNVQSHAKLAL